MAFSAVLLRFAKRQKVLFKPTQLEIRWFMRGVRGIINFYGAINFWWDADLEELNFIVLLMSKKQTRG